MSLELLTSIREAEAKAESIRADAQREARDMVKATETACSQAERSAAVDQRALYQRLMEENRARVQAELDAKSKELAKERQAMCAQAEKHLNEAAKLIFERIVKHGDR